MVIGLVYINYRSTKKIHRSLLSLAAKSSVRHVAIVGDNSGEYVACGHERIINFGENLGFGRAVNICVKELNTDYIAIINPDTVFETDILAASLVFFSHDRVGFVSAVQKSTVTGQPMASFGALPNIGHSFLQILPFHFVPSRLIKAYWPLRELEEGENTFESCFGAYLFVSADTFIKFNGFDEMFFLYYEETDFCKRLIDHGYTNYALDDGHSYLHDIGFSARQEDHQSSSHMSLSRYKYFVKHYGVFYAQIDRFLLKISFWKKIFRQLF